MFLGLSPDYQKDKEEAERSSHRDHSPEKRRKRYDLCTCVHVPKIHTEHLTGRDSVCTRVLCLYCGTTGHAAEIVIVSVDDAVVLGTESASGVAREDEIGTATGTGIETETEIEEETETEETEEAEGGTGAGEREGRGGTLGTDIIHCTLHGSCTCTCTLAKLMCMLPLECCVLENSICNYHRTQNTLLSQNLH